MRSTVEAGHRHVTADQILPLLHGVRPTHNGWMALCPAHDDKQPSLHIRDANGKLLLHCFAGCTFEEILVSLLGTSSSNDRPVATRNAPPISRTFSQGSSIIIATYDYVSEFGDLLFQVLRYSPKDFRQRRPDPARPGHWIWNLKGSRGVLYRLPAVLKAKAQDEIIFVAEGEKDCDALAALGLCATCNAGGAVSRASQTGKLSKWQAEYTAVLSGARIVVIADKDEAGRRHADLLCEELHGKAESVRRIELPDRSGHAVKDAFDWIGAGGTADELMHLVSSTPEWAAAATGDIPTAATPISRHDPRTIAEKASLWFILPSSCVSYTESAKQIFSTIGPTNTLFIREQRVVEIVQLADSSSALSLVTADEFRSRIERYGRTIGIHRADHNSPGLCVLKPSRCSRDIAATLLADREVSCNLPGIQSIASAPIITEENGKSVILKKGYNAIHGGIFITNGRTSPKVSLKEAVSSLLKILDDFDFLTEADRARAIAGIITPALRMGRFIRDDIPISMAEADQSQSGKTYYQRIVTVIYGEIPYVITSRKGGVGSFDESLSHALIAGRPFILFDNIRGPIDSCFLESIARGTGRVHARIPHRGEMEIDVRRFIFQVSSNGIETTQDLSNRSSIIRIKKRSKNYAFRQWKEGALIDHVTANQPYYLGCVFAVIQAWHAAGKCLTHETRHDFRTWAGTLDWIVQNLFNLPPLLDGHLGAQRRTSNSTLTWLRTLALKIEESGQIGCALSASNLYELGREADISVPGLYNDSNEKAVRQYIGKLMAKLFLKNDLVEMEGFTIRRQETKEYYKISRQPRNQKRYIFERGGK